MRKVNTVFNVVFALGIVLFAVITAMCLYFKCVCVSEWIMPNIVLCSSIEVIICVWIIHYIKKSAGEILRTTRDLDVLMELFRRIKGLSFFGILYGIINLFEAIGIFRVPSGYTKWLFVYALNILFIALIFFFWMHFLMRNIKRRQEFWN